MKKIIAKNKDGELIKTSYRNQYMFSSRSISRRKIIFEHVNNHFSIKLHPLVRCGGIKKLFPKEVVKTQQKRRNKEKQLLVTCLYKQMLKNKSFIPPGYIRYNSRYDKEFNYYSIIVPYKLLDAKHVFLKLMYANSFKYNWGYFLNNYNRLESYLKNNLSARQMLISFVSEYGKINKLWKNKKFKWIIQETPYFYLKTLRVIRYLNSDDLDRFYKYEQSTCYNDMRDPAYKIFPDIHFSNKKNVIFNNKKRVKRTANIGVSNGILNPTMSIVNLFNNKPAEIFIANSNLFRQTYLELSRFVFLVNNDHLKFISTDAYFIMNDCKNIIIPNMKYATHMIRNFEKEIFLNKKITPSEVCRYIEKIMLYLDRVKSKRTREFIKIKLENMYLRYKLG